MELSSLTEKIIGYAYPVSNGLDTGFLEKVGEYVSDVVVESTILIELKACKTIDDVHVAQCLN